MDSQAKQQMTNFQQDIPIPGNLIMATFQAKEKKTYSILGSFGVKLWLSKTIKNDAWDFVLRHINEMNSFSVECNF